MKDKPIGKKQFNQIKDEAKEAADIAKEAATISDLPNKAIDAAAAMAIGSVVARELEKSK